MLKSKLLILALAGGGIFFFIKGMAKPKPEPVDIPETFNPEINPITKAVAAIPIVAKALKTVGIIGTGAGAAGAVGSASIGTTTLVGTNIGGALVTPATGAVGTVGAGTLAAGAAVFVAPAIIALGVAKLLDAIFPKYKPTEEQLKAIEMKKEFVELSKDYGATYTKNLADTGD